MRHFVVTIVGGGGLFHTREPSERSGMTRVRADGIEELRATRNTAQFEGLGFPLIDPWATPLT